MEIMMLNDEELGEVVGGSNAGDGVAYVGAAASIIAAPVAFGCSVARSIKKYKMHVAKSKGDKKAVKQYRRSINKLDAITTLSSGLAAAGVIGMVVGASYSGDIFAVLRPNNNNLN